MWGPVAHVTRMTSCGKGRVSRVRQQVPRTSDAPTRVRSAGEPAALARECGPVRAGVGSRSSRNGRVALRPSPRPHRQIFGSPTLDVRTSGRQESLLQPSEEEASSALCVQVSALTVLKLPVSGQGQNPAWALDIKMHLAFSASYLGKRMKELHFC